MLKLKKALLGFMVAAIAAAGFMSCSSDNDDGSEPTVRINVTASSSIIAPEETSTLTASVEGAVFTIESGSEYAKLEGSVVTGVKEGEVVIRATADGYLSGTVTIKVTNVAIVLEEDGPDGTDSPLFLRRAPRTVRVVPSTATLEISSGADYFDAPVNNEDGTWTVSVKNNISTSRNFYFATLTATSGENSTKKDVAVFRGLYSLSIDSWGKTNTGKSMYAGIPYYSETVDNETVYKLYITWAADGITDALKYYPFTSWDVGEDGNTLLCYGYESEEKLKSGEYSVSVAQYYQGSTKCADFADKLEGVTAYQLISGSAYENQYEGEYYNTYLKDKTTTYTSTLSSGNTTLPVIVDLKSNVVSFTSNTYYGSYSYNVWTKTSSGWTVNSYVTPAYIRAGRPCATIDLGNKTISINVANQMGDFNAQATTGYGAYTSAMNVPVSFSGSIEEPAAMLSCWVTAMGGQEFGHAVLKGYKITQNQDGTYSCTLSTGTGVGVIFGIGFVAFIDPTGNGSDNADTVKAAQPKYYDAEGSLQDAVFTTSEKDLGTLPSVKQVNVVDSITFPVRRDQSEYNLWMYINSNIMGVQFCDGKGSSSSNHPGEATPYVGKFTIDWDRVTIE